ncbi:MAG TPA: hypothetical protein VKB09_13160 [Thermomicrobiales bacterium]|nr:hypothetical protein [Thermomicrobiales bacterium]
MDAALANSAFVVGGWPDETGASPLFGVWKTTPARPAVAFALDSKQEPATGPRWEAKLPAGLAADEALRGAGQAVHEAYLALPEAARRLDAYATSRRAGVSFAATAAEEAELDRYLRALRQDAVAFGLGDRLDAVWDEVIGPFRAAFDEALQQTGNLAWVETEQAGTRLGQTVVSWTGDVRTAWRAGLDRTEADLHRRHLDLALDARQTLLRAIALAVQGAAVVAAAVTPGGALLVLPAVWRFVTRISGIIRNAG